MFKKSVLFTVMALGLSLNASAETFSVGTNVTKTLTPVTVAEKTAMVIPAINVDEGTPLNVAVCDSEGADYHPGKGYCSGAFNNGVYTISGSPHSEVSVTFPTVAVKTNGMAFYGYRDNMGGGSIHAVTTDAAGDFDVTMHGIVHLEDLSQVTSGNTVFNFDLTAVYY